MRRLSAQWVITNSGPVLKRAVITTADDGRIIAVEDTGGNLAESRSVEFYNGVIIPGFVNCHAHLELSHMKGAIDEGLGLVGFLEGIRTKRESDTGKIISSAAISDADMYRDGIELCADICNNTLTFDIKKKSKIKYISLIEVFGIDSSKAEKRMDEALAVYAMAKRTGLPGYIVPHTVYSVSVPLFRILKKEMSENRISSIHFMESEDEKRFFSGRDNPMLKSYLDSGLLKSDLQIPKDHVDAVINEMTASGNLILVHNTFADKKTVKKIKSRSNTYWCLCPLSNLYIENHMPPVEMLMAEGCDIVIGTDSMASNKAMSIISELKALQNHFPSLNIEDLVRWSTYNGARALHEGKMYGSLKPGMKPGILLLENADLINFRLLPGTTVRRLI